MRSILAGLVLATVACGTSQSEGVSAPGGEDSPGGGVSFGGAQDIGELRSILDRGELPGPDTFDANGFFNEHYNAPAPTTCTDLLCLASGLSVGRDWLTGAHQATLQIAIQSNVDPAQYQRLPMNLVVVVDHSGSMASDNRLEKVKAGLHTLIDNLRAEDRLALVEFDDVVTVDATLGTALDRAKLHAIVTSLQPRGATNIYDGLAQGFRLLGDAPSSDRQNRVIFLSDGLATAGDTSQANIMMMAKGSVARGIGLTTIGVGNDFDVNLMRGLAEQGAGNFYYLEDPTAATEVFTEELDYFMQPIALDVRVDATPSSAYQLGEVVGSRLWVAEANRGAMQIPAVFVASRTSQGGDGGRRGGGSMLFLQLKPINEGSARVADITLSYRAPGSSTRTTQTVSLDYRAPAGDAVVYLSGPEMAERFAMYNTFLGIRAATQAYDPSCATAALQATRAQAEAWNATHEDPDIAADLALIDQYLANLAEYRRTHGYSETIVAYGTCADGNYPPYQLGDDVVDHRTGFVCSAGGPTGSLPVLLAALGAVALRRRRRR